METPKLNKAPAFVLASIISAYPDEQYAESVGVLFEDEALDAPFAIQNQQTWARLRGQLERLMTAPEKLDDLRSEYISIFDSGRGGNSPYETEFGRDRALLKANELADIAAFYNAFGMEFGAEGLAHEMLDHISVELEFYALLLMKQRYLEEMADTTGVEITLDARKKFLKDHLGRFVKALSERPGVIGSDFYSSAFDCIRDLVLGECNELGVEPLQATWESTQGDNAEITCGGSVGCVPS